MPSLEETGFGAVDHAVVVSAVNSELDKNPRSSYTRYTPKDRYLIGKYSNENGASAAARKFKYRFPRINESTVREFMKKYREKLQLGGEDAINTDKELGGDIRRGRPLLLGPLIDEDVRKFISALRYRGGQVSFSIAIAVAKALIERSNNEGLKLIEFGKDWAQSLFRRMGFKKRSATTGKVKIPDGARKEAELVFLHDIVNKVEMHDIPRELVFNLDQTPSKYIQSSRYTMEKAGTKSVAIVGAGDKRAITATFVIDLAGNFLPMQLIYGGKTNRSIPKMSFPDGFSLSANPKHYSNTEESIKIIKEIIIPQVTSRRESFNLAPDAPALLIMDVFRGQMTNEVMDFLETENILVTCVPNNMTHLFQPLDLTVNSWAKNFMKEKFATWYAQQVKESLDRGIKIDDVDIKMPLTVIKPLHGKWIIELYNVLTSAKGKEIILSGWRAAGILGAVEQGMDKLPTLDPFEDLEPLTTNDDTALTTKTFPESGHPEVNIRDIDSDSEYEYDLIDEEDRNAFDFIVDY